MKLFILTTMHQETHTAISARTCGKNDTMSQQWDEAANLYNERFSHFTDVQTFLESH